MVYSGGFVSSIVLSNNTHIKEKKNGTVYIPFGSEYGIYLKNKTPQRAKAVITVDNELVGSFVVNAYSNWTIWRYSNKDRALKFVSKDNKKAIKAGKSGLDNNVAGVVEVKWYKEQQYNQYISIETKPWTPPPKPAPLPCGKPWIVWNTTYTPPLSISHFMGSESEPIVGMNCCNTTRGDTKISNDNETGVTVKGGRTNQKFINTHFYAENEYTVHVLQLKGYEGQPIERKKYCEQCGSKIRKRAKFCAECGKKI